MEGSQKCSRPQEAAKHYRAAYRKEKRTNRLLVAILAAVTALLILLLIKNTASSAEAERLSAPAEKYYKSIVVDSGDSLWSIAEKYGNEDYSSIYDYMQEVVNINHLNSDQLTQGNTLCVPYYK